MGSKMANQEIKEVLLYQEKVTSTRTAALFLGLALLFMVLVIQRLSVSDFDGWATAFLIFFMIFLFYVVNYWALSIRITSAALVLSFGIFHWRVLLDNIASCVIDDIPPFLRYGGAGIHFMTVHERYRVNFNFLELPRLVVALKHRAGPVKDISFSTQKPEDILNIIGREIQAYPASPKRHSVSMK
jgi:hypothetical protein